MARPHAQSEVREAVRVREAIVVLNEVMAAEDQSVPRSILEKAEAIAVFPGLIKAGFVVGGQFGRGLISVRDPATKAWARPGS